MLYKISNSRTFQFFGEIYSRVETDRQVVALTFDDGPRRGQTDEILAVLREENVVATFYLVGKDIEENPGEVEKIIADGHEIGNHTYAHKRMVLVTPNFVRDEIEKTDELIAKAGGGRDVTFRPPYGKKLFALPFYLSERNRRTVTWDVEPETFFEKSEDMVRFTVENTKNGSIILLHVMYDNRAESMKSVRPIIRSLREKGFQFKTVSELISTKNQI